MYATMGRKGRTMSLVIFFTILATLSALGNLAAALYVVANVTLYAFLHKTGQLNAGKIKPCTIIYATTFTIPTYIVLLATRRAAIKKMEELEKKGIDLEKIEEELINKFGDTAELQFDGEKFFVTLPKDAKIKLPEVIEVRTV